MHAWHAFSQESFSLIFVRLRKQWLRCTPAGATMTVKDPWLRSISILCSTSWWMFVQADARQEFWSHAAESSVILRSDAGRISLPWPGALISLWQVAERTPVDVRGTLAKVREWTCAKGTIHFLVCLISWWSDFRNRPKTCHQWLVSTFCVNYGFPGKHCNSCLMPETTRLPLSAHGRGAGTIRGGGGSSSQAAHQQDQGGTMGVRGGGDAMGPRGPRACMHACMSVHLRTGTQICMHTPHTYIHACMHKRTYIHRYIHTSIHTFIHAYLHTYLHTYMHT